MNDGLLEFSVPNTMLSQRKNVILEPLISIRFFKIHLIFTVVDLAKSDTTRVRAKGSVNREYGIGNINYNNVR